MKNAVRRTVFLLVVAVVGVYGFLALRGPQGIPALQEKWREIRALEESNAAIQRENQYRRDRIKKLQESPSAQELEIRKNLKLNRPGETSFILPDAPKADQSKPDQTGPQQSTPEPGKPDRTKPADQTKPDAPPQPK